MLHPLMVRRQQMRKAVESKKCDGQHTACDASSGAAAKFELDNFVWLSRIDPRLSDFKRMVHWFGLFVITEMKMHCFEAKNLITEALNDVYELKLELYSKPVLEVTEALCEHISTQGLLLRVNEICDLRNNDSDTAWEIKAAWVELKDYELRESRSPASMRMSLA